MNLSGMTDQTLLEATRCLVIEEREILTSILHHLREIERRRLYCDLKYSSLFAYAVGELKYSESQADRRISAMRLLRDMPEIEEKITTGALSLTNLVMAQTLFSKERQAGRAVTVQSKKEILARLENQTTREAQKIVCAINPEMEAKRPALDFDNIEDGALRTKLLKLKGRIAHTHPHISLNDLLHRLCDQALSEPTTKSPSAPRVHSEAHARREVWKRDGNQCVNCASPHAVQIDHIIPRAFGGSSTIENMRLLCRKCNQRAAIREFGVRKMDKFLRTTVNCSPS